MSNEQEVKEPELTPEQKYFNDIVTKYRENPNNETLTATEKTLLAKISESETRIVENSKLVDQLNEEIRERQAKGDRLVQEIQHFRGKIQGFIDSLLALRSE